MKNAYVVSADIYSLLKNWAIKKDFILPDHNFFKKLRFEFIEFFKEIFPNFIFLDEKEIILKMSKMLKEEKLAIISLETAYCQSKYNLDICRVIDINGNDCGYSKRDNSKSLLRQINDLKGQGIKKIALVDDVIFSGKSVLKIINLLKKINIKVSLVYTAVALSSAIKKLEPKVRVISIFVFDEVIDEICERDFYPGVPYSGRQVKGNKNIRAPYIYPFGNPEKWASIPINKAKELSIFCIKQSIKLFKEIELKSKKDVLCSHIDYQLLGLDKNKKSFIKALYDLI